MECCAYCYAEDVSLQTCSKCHKRKYCSGDCQRKDWNKPGGQCHKFYCGKTGEYGRCFEIKPAGEKGFGLYAKRDFKKFEMIVAERRLLSYDDFKRNPNIFSNMPDSERDAFMNLAPSTGQIFEKFIMNGFGDEGNIFVHMSRVNHDCFANTSYAHIVDRDVQIMVAKKAIKAGEEITTSYEHLLYMSPSVRRSRLKRKYGICCERHCSICSNPTLDKRAEELNKAQREFLECLLEFSRKNTGKSELDRILKMGSDLREFYDEFEVQPSPYINLFNMLSMCCLIQNRKLDMARKFLDLSLENGNAFTGSDQEASAVTEALLLKKIVNGEMNFPTSAFKEMLSEIASSFIL
eukprot:CAMPEP_0194100156 /NCGR_PEP_ID=MMETSP0150-20130528/1127_1 /TAXON_ID=122233 /ORGANISM="Chaetoceros debilis, Strain MM31A-1" /LENGTH=349 /DNA_ID=CAMNT_0038786485 /DNA_START=84 /DNA_END=1133 /DNA_ORIENTATION=+